MWPGPETSQTRAGPCCQVRSVPGRRRITWRIHGAGRGVLASGDGFGYGHDAVRLDEVEDAPRVVPLGCDDAE